MLADDDNLRNKAKTYKKLGLRYLLAGVGCFIIGVIPRHMGFAPDNLWEILFFWITSLLLIIAISNSILHDKTLRKLKYSLKETKILSAVSSYCLNCFFLLFVFGVLFVFDKDSKFHAYSTLYNITQALLIAMFLLFSSIADWLESRNSKKPTP